MKGKRGPQAAPSLACIIGVLALLITQVLLPTLHFATGTPLAAKLGAAIHSHSHVGTSHHHDKQEQPDKSQSDGVDHQVCHFCRLMGAALPPLFAVQIGRLSGSGAASWHLADQAVRPEDHFQTGHPVRAPPSIS
jgi:hypothetical protein